MATEWFNAGRVSLVPRGGWDDSIEYKRLDVVTSPDGTASYIAIRDTPAGAALTDGTYWHLMASVAGLTVGSIDIKYAADRLASPFAETGDLVECHPVEDYPLTVAATLKPAQEGSGDPTPDNVRAILGQTGATVINAPANWLDPAFAADADDAYTGPVSIDANGRYAAVNTLGKRIYPYTGWQTVPVGTYCFQTDEAVGDINIYLQKTEGDMSNLITSTNKSVVVDIAEGDQIRVYLDIGAGDTSLQSTFGVWLSRGEAQTLFTAYERDMIEYTADFGETVYGGEWSVTGGSMVSDWKVYTVTGTEAVEGYNINDKMRFQISGAVAGIYPSAAQNLNMVCSHYTTAANPIADNGADHCIAGFQGLDTVFIRDDSFSSASAFKTWLQAQYNAGTPVQIAYRLAEPIKTISTGAVSIPGVDGANVFFSPSGTVTVSGRIAPEYMNEQLKNAIIALGGNV